ncbi:MAG: NAD kinase [Bacteroidales bacterium]
MSFSMRVAIYGRTFDASGSDQVRDLIRILEQSGASLIIEEQYLRLLAGSIPFASPPAAFHRDGLRRGDADYLLSIGGDGTILDTVTIVRDSGIPVLGINTGRLGFLSSVAKDEMEPAISLLNRKQFLINERTLLRADSDEHYFGPTNYALNELTVHRKETPSLIAIQVWVDDVFVNAYWADGLIVSTPTGSTGYSLSCGGPIVYPQAGTFVITPIATHNLTVRPLVIPDDKSVKVVVDERYGHYTAGLDSRYCEIAPGNALVVKKEEFRFNLIQFEEEEFFNTIREKLKWGLDTRN